MSRTWKNPVDAAAGHGGSRAAEIGQAGVHAVAAQLILRGHNVYFPAVDKGVDIVLDNGLRLQVKATHITYPICGYPTHETFGVRGGKVVGNYRSGAYIFGVRRGQWHNNEKQYSKKYNRTYAEVADFFVLWGIDENRFWIVPTSIKNRNIYFGRKDAVNGSANRSYTEALKQKRLVDMESRWDLLDVNSVGNLVEETATVPEKENA